jgi:hypothetical protein
MGNSPSMNHVPAGSSFLNNTDISSLLAMDTNTSLNSPAPQESAAQGPAIQKSSAEQAQNNAGLQNYDEQGNNLSFMQTFTTDGNGVVEEPGHDDQDAINEYLYGSEI